VPPAEKVFAANRDEFKNRSRWTYVSIDGAPGVEMNIGELRNRVESGSVLSSGVSVYLTAEAAWMPLAVVDLPF
jgi:hypothetical protein